MTKIGRNIWLCGKRKIRPSIEPITEFLAIEGTENPQVKRKIESKLNEKYENKPLDENALAKDLTELTGTERFDNLGYGITRRDDKTGLLVRVYDPRERTERTTVLEVGADVNNSDNDDVNFNARARLTFFDVGGDGNEWRNDFSVGSRTFIATEFYRPFKNTRFFAAPNAFYEDRKVSFYADGNRLAEYNFRTAANGNRFWLQSEPQQRTARRLFNRTFERRSTNRKLASFSDLSGKVSFASARFNYDTRDNAQIPTRGIENKSSLNYYFDASGRERQFRASRIKSQRFSFGQRQKR